jgi:hypothetical protein
MSFSTEKSTIMFYIHKVIVVFLYRQVALIIDASHDFFLCVCVAGIWTQGFALADALPTWVTPPVLFALVVLEMGSHELFAWLAPSHHPPSLSLWSSQDWRCEPLCLACCFFTRRRDLFLLLSGLGWVAGKRPFEMYVCVCMYVCLHMCAHI